MAWLGAKQEAHAKLLAEQRAAHNLRDLTRRAEMAVDERTKVRLPRRRERAG